MYSKNSSTANWIKFKTYFNERFPLLPLSLYIFVTMLGINSLFKSNDIIKILLLALIYLLFLFHLRIMDEFKDYLYDKKNHPDRPVQKGLITLKTLKIIGALNFFVIIALALFICLTPVLYLLLFALMYTGFMFKEFFVSDFLRKKPAFYLISHQVVFVPLFLFFYSVFHNSIWLINNLSRISTLIYTILPVVIIEIGRKLKHRYNKKGQKTDDTYAYIWGEQNSVRLFAILIFFAGILSFFIPNFKNYLSFILVICALVIFLGSYTFYKLIINRSMAMTTIFALFLPLLLLL